MVASSSSFIMIIVIICFGFQCSFRIVVVVVGVSGRERFQHLTLKGYGKSLYTFRHYGGAKTEDERG